MIVNKKSILKTSKIFGILISLCYLVIAFPIKNAWFSLIFAVLSVFFWYGFVKNINFIFEDKRLKRFNLYFLISFIFCVLLMSFMYFFEKHEIIKYIIIGFIGGFLIFLFVFLRMIYILAKLTNIKEFYVLLAGFFIEIVIFLAIGSSLCPHGILWDVVYPMLMGLNACMIFFGTLEFYKKESLHVKDNS